MITSGPPPGAGESSRRPLEQKYMVSPNRYIRQWGLWERELDGQEEEEKTTRRTRAGRALRNRRYRRLVEDARRTKRLFTPEIKKFLKGWLIRRRKNPYPNRSEKKDLALKTGLTYMQICNWFANWRRKLKKSCREAKVGHETWGPLITGYNRQARGNVEQFSISSDDSIWDEANYNHPGSHSQTLDQTRTFCTQVCTPQQSTPSASSVQPWTPPGPDARPPAQTPQADTPVLLKWLESAARFRPREVCRTVASDSWSSHSPRRPRAQHRPSVRGRHREELDAAEALTFLSHSSTLRGRGQCV